MEANPDNCHFIGSTSIKVGLIVENMEIDNSTHESLLGVNIDSKFFFNASIDDICKKADLKLNALSRVPLIWNLKRKGYW